MHPSRLRKIMIALFFVSILVMVVASYVLKDTPREGGFVNTGPGGLDKLEKTEYYPTGELRAKGRMDGYYKDGQWIYYQKDGTIELIEYYTKGNVDSTWVNDK